MGKSDAHTEPDIRTVRPHPERCREFIENAAFGNSNDDSLVFRGNMIGMEKELLTAFPPVTVLSRDDMGSASLANLPGFRMREQFRSLEIGPVQLRNRLGE
jgi:hypothetical protein